jgi:hypothetical protein
MTIETRETRDLAGTEPDLTYETNLPAEIQPPPSQPTSRSNLTTSLAAAASTAAAAIMVSSVFRDFAAHFVALGGVVLGIGVLVLSWRWRRASILQYAVIPLALFGGAILMTPDARGGSANLLSLVADAVRTGGILQPPAPFDPGWRLILFVLFALLAAGAASVAISTRRPKLGVLIPVPLTMGAALLQPPATEIATTAIALILGVTALMLAYGVELSAAGQVGAGFESRRLVRAAAVAGLLTAFVVAASNLGILFPGEADRNRVVPPQRPHVSATEPDRVLFTYSATQAMPLRVGVIDVYDVKAGAWELPPFDASRFKRLQVPASLPGSSASGAASVNATFTYADASGHALASVFGASQVEGGREILDYDPRTQTIRLADKPVFAGLTYTVTGGLLPSGKDLAQSSKPESSYAEYLTAPTPPTEVVALLNSYSQAALKQNLAEDSFNRLQFLRQALYSKVVAAGPGTPVDVRAPRVAQMLNGAEASPYEITAAEALLARWADVPSRIGYGYYGGEKRPDGTFEIRPKHGSTWIETYFRGYGWVPIVGIPPKAKPSTSQHEKNPQNITASDNLALVVYIPVEYPTITLLYEYVRYALLWAVPIALAILLIVIGYPALLKVLRRRRRREWAMQSGAKHRIAVAYAEFRDVARDLNIGNPSATPVEFTEAFITDPEHEELAWLATRALWGDLGRDLRREDADAAERLAKSVTDRMWRAQPGVNIVLALIARSSLREPFSDEIPNLWIQRKSRAATGRGWRRVRARLSTMRRSVRRVAAIPAALIPLLLLAGCGTSQATQRSLPASLVPGKLGDIVLQREPKAEAQYQTAGPTSLVSDGRVYTVRHDDTIEGSVQLVLFKPKVSTEDMTDNMSDHCVANPEECPGHEVFKGVQRSFGSGRFQRVYVQGARVYEMQLSDQRVYVWFPPRTESMTMVILRQQFSKPSSDALVVALLQYQHGGAPSPVPLPGSPSPPVFPSASPYLGVGQ